MNELEDEEQHEDEQLEDEQLEDELHTQRIDISAALILLVLFICVISDCMLFCASSLVMFPVESFAVNPSVGKSNGDLSYVIESESS